MEVDWGGKPRANCVDDWGGHETRPNGHSITEVDWGCHGASPYNMNESLSSEVDWGGHDAIPTI